jgi:rhodanese-related sulfurtransferase
MAHRSVSPREAATLLQDRDDVAILDVRTPQEYEQLGHVPGAWLLPVDLIASAPAVLPDDGRPVLVYCEHGVRSAAAARWLDAAGVPNVIDMTGGMSRWTGPRAFDEGRLRGPSTWLIENADLLPRGGRVLDVASGRGRHALLLAAAGFPVDAIDRDAGALAALAKAAAAVGVDVTTRVVDLERDDEAPSTATTADPSTGSGSSRASSRDDLRLPTPDRYDVVLVFNYLHRPLMPALRDAVKPGGVLFYETFLVGQAERGHPKNPAFLLEPGELATLVSPLTILRSREGEVHGNLVASVVARQL